MKLSRNLVIVTTIFAVFGIGHLRELVAHGEFGCAVAAAQSWDGGSSGAGDTATEPDKKAPPPDVAGEWGGELDDVHLGSSEITMDIQQKGAKLSGHWSSEFGGTKLKGSVKGDGDLKMNLKAGGGGCHLNAVGQLVAEGEIMMTYKVRSCKGTTNKDHGSIDIFAAP